MKIFNLLSVLLLSVLSIFPNQSKACNDASATLISIVDLGAGQTEYTIDACVEFNGFEGAPDWFSLEFEGTGVTILSFTPATVTTALGDPYNGAIVSGGTSTEVRWTTPAIFPLQTGNQLCFQAVIVVTGTPTTLTLNAHDTYPSADCYIDIPLPAPPSPCDCNSVADCGGIHYDCSSEAEADFNDFFSTNALYTLSPALPGANSGTYQFCWEYTTGPTETSVGFVNLVGYNGTGSCFTKTYEVYPSGSCGAPLTPTGPSNFGFNGFEYDVLPNTSYTFCVTANMSSCAGTDFTENWVWIYNNSGSTGCGTCSAPCTDPGMGNVPTYADRTYLDCWQPDCDVDGPATITNCFDVQADATGFVGIVLGGSLSGGFGCGPLDFNPTWTLSSGCGATIPNPVTNANGHSIGFNPEYSGLTPNATYVLCVTVQIPFGCTLDATFDELCMDYYGTSCVADLTANIQDGDVCKDDGIPLSTTTNYTQTNLTGAVQEGFLVFCNQPPSPLTPAFLQTHFDAILETGDAIGDFINNAGDYVDPFNPSQTCSGSIWLVPITISAYSTGGGFIIDYNCYDTETPVEVTLGVPPTVTTSAVPTTICGGESTLITATGGGTYNWSTSPPGTSASGMVMPSSTTTYMVTVTDASGNCTTIDDVTVMVTTPTLPTFNNPGPLCETDASVTLPTTSINGITGTWVPATIDPSGGVDVTANFTPDAGQCADPATLTVVVNPATTPAFTNPGPLCETDPSVTLPTTSTNGVTGTWVPATIDPSGGVDVTANFTPDAGQCANTTSITVVVNPATTPAFTNPGPLCEADPSVTLLTTSTNGITGTWVPATIDPSGGVDVTATFTPAAGQCGTTTTLTVTVNPATTPTFNNPGPLCETDPSVTLPTTSTNGVTGTWVPATVDPSGGVDVTANFTPDAGQCANTTSITVTVTSGTTPTFNNPGPLCETDPSVMLPTTSTNGITGTWVPATIDPSGGVDVTANFTPDAGQCGLPTSLTVVVNAATIPTFNNPGPLCETDPSVTLPTTSTNGITGTWVPATIDPSGGVDVTANFTPAAGQCANTTSLTVVVNSATTPTFNNPGPLCETDPTVTLPTTSTNGITGTWVPATINPSGGVDVTANFTPAAGQCANTTSITVMVTGGILPTFNNPGPLCETDASVTLPTTSINGITGTWAPATIDPSGGVDVTANFTPNAGQCGLSFTMTVVINAATTPTFTNPGPLCETDPSVTLPTTSTNGVTGSWVPAIVDPSGGVDVTATFTPNVGQCATTTTLTVVIDPSVTPTFNNPGPLCETDATVTLPTTSTNGVTGTWAPATIDPSGGVNVTATFTPAAGQCAPTTTMTIVVNNATLPTFTNPGPLCEADPTLTLPTTSTNGITGTWIPATIDPSGGVDVTATFTPAAGQCASTTTLTVVIDPAIIPTFSNPGPLCETDPSVTLPTTSSNGVAGTWSPAVVDPSVAVNVTATFTPAAGQCATTITMTVVINSATVPTFTNPGPLCETEPSVTLPTTSSNGIPGTWVPATIDPSGGVDVTATFTPNAGQCATTTTMTVVVNASPTISVVAGCTGGLGTGTITTTANPGSGGSLSYTINASPSPTGNATNQTNGSYTVIVTESPSGCTAAQTVSVNCDCPTITINGNLSLCEGGSETYTQTGGAGGGTWTVSPVSAGTISATGVFNAAAGFTGGATITYTAVGCNGALAITVDPNITPTFANPGPLCENDPSITLTTTSIDGITGTWSPTSIDPSGGTDVTATFTPSAGQCAVTTTLTVVVDPALTPTFTNPGPVCEADASFALPTTSSNGVAGTWSPATIDPSIGSNITATFTPDPSECANTTTMTIVVNTATIPAFNNPGPLCQNDPTITLPTTSTNGVTGTWAPAQVDPSAGTNVTATFTPTAGQCANTTTLTVVVNTSIVPNFNNPGPLCQTDPVLALSTSSTNGISGTWSPASIDPSGGSNVTATFTPTAGQCASTTTMTVQIDAAITPTFNNPGPLCQSANNVTMPLTSIEGISGTWNPAVIDPSGGVDVTTTFTPNAGQCANGTSLTVFVNPSPTMSVATGCTGGLGTGTITTTAAPGAGGGLSYTILTAPNTNGNATNLTNGSYTVIVTEAPSGCSVQEIVSINCDCPTITVAGPTDFCQGGNETYTQTGAAAGGTWSVIPAAAGTVSAAGLFTPNATFNGSATISYEEGGCSGTLAITVTQNTTPTFSNPGPLCQTATPVVLTTTSIEGITGTWSPTSIDPSGGTDVTATFTPDAGLCATTTTMTVFVDASPTISVATGCTGGLNTGTITTTAAPGAGGGLSYTILTAPNTNGNATGLANGSYTVVVTENPSGCSVQEIVNISCDCPTVTVAGNMDFCQGTASETYTQTGAAAGGTWTITPTTAGSITNAGVFTPNATFNGSVTITYEAGGCSGLLNVTVNPLPTLSVVTGCTGGLGTGTIVSTGTAAAGGTLSYDVLTAPHTNGNATALANGPYTVVVTENPSGCSTEEIVNINCDCPTVMVAGNMDFCQGTTSETYTQTGGDLGGTWTITPTTAGSITNAGVFTPSATYNGPVTITYEAGGCSGLLNVTVNPLPTLSVVTGCAGGLGTGTIVSTGTAAAGGTLSYDVLTAPHTNGNATALANGAYTVVVTENPSGCSTEEIVNINCDCPTVTVAGNMDFCQGTASETYTQTGGDLGGTWTITPTTAGSITNAGVFTPSATYNGPVTITYEAGGCSGLLNVTVNPLPTLSVVTGCTGGLGTGTIVSTGTAAAGGTLSYDVLTAPHTNGNATALANGAYTVVVTENPSGCSTEEIVNINCDCPTVTVAGNMDICQGTASETYTQTGAAAGGTWTTTPTTAGSITNAGVFTPSATYNGSVTITYEAGGCSGLLNVTVNPLPTLSVITGCAGGLGTGTILSTGTAAAGGTLSYDVQTAPHTNGNATALANGPYTVIVTEMPSGCSAEETVTINCSCPTITVSGNNALCQGTSETYTQMGGNNGGTWSILPTNAGSISASGVFTSDMAFAGAVTITYADGACTGELMVTVTPMTTPTFTNPGPLCQTDATITLPTTSIEGITGTWSPAIVNPMAGTDVMASFTPDANQCAAAATMTIAVNASPTISVATDCGGGLNTGELTTTATPSNGGTLSYTINAAIDADGNEINLTNGSYVVVVTEMPSGCTASETVNINCGCPTITLAGNDNLCAGTTTAYTQMGGDAGGTWAVLPANAGVIDATGNFIADANFSGTATIEYTATGCNGVLNITINPTQNPMFAAINPLCQTDAAVTLPTTSLEGVTGTWLPTSIDPSAGTDVTATFTPDAGQCAMTTMITVTVNVTVTPSFALVGPLCQTDAPVILTNVSNEGITGTWSPSSIDPSAGTDVTATFTPDAGQCAASTMMTVTVNGSTTPTFATVAPLCQSDAAVTLPTTSNEGVTGVWVPASIDPSGGVDVMATFNPDAGQCAVSMSITVAVSNPTVSCMAISGISVLGANDGVADITIGGGNPMYTIDWDGPLTGTLTNQLTGIVQLTDLNPGAYSVTLTDATGCTSTCGFTINDAGCNISASAIASPVSCFGGANGMIDLTVNGAIGATTFMWNPATAVGQNPMSLSQGTYQVTVSDAMNCTAVAMATVSEPAAISLACAATGIISGPGAMDGTAEVTVSGGTAPYSLDWTGPNPGMLTNQATGIIGISNLGAGNYTVVIMDANMCSETCNFTITDVNCNLVITGTSTPVTCSGDMDGSILITPTGANGTVQYSWDTAGLSGANPMNVIDGTYMVTATDGAGCTAEETIVVGAGATLVPNIIAQSPFCFGENNGSIQIESTSGGAEPYQFTFNGQTSTNATFDNLSAGIYDVIVTDADGCSTTEAFTLTEPSEVFIQTAPDTTLFFGDSIQIQTTTNVSDIMSLTWTPSEGLQCDTCLQPIAKPTTSTQYIVQIEDANGCVDLDTIFIFVLRDPRIYIPNVFQPNDSGNNDVFSIGVGPEVTAIRSFAIYDRWGEKVYYGSNLNMNDSRVGWDGRYNGKMMNPGVYIYVIEVDFIDGSTELYKGSITLVR